MCKLLGKLIYLNTSLYAFTIRFPPTINLIVLQLLPPCTIFCDDQSDEFPTPEMCVLLRAWSWNALSA